MTDKVDMKREDGQLDWDATAEFATTRTSTQLWNAVTAIQGALSSARDLDLHCPQPNNISREGVYCDEISVYRNELRVRRCTSLRRVSSGWIGSTMPRKVANYYAHRNLRDRTWSITRRGKLVCNAPAVIMENCELRVRPGGRARVLKDRVKNVHAFVIGDIVDARGVTEFFEKGAEACTYDPYSAGCFYLTDHAETGVTHAERVLLDSNGKMWVGGQITLKKIVE